ncbi:MAG: hypothetical protein M3022_05535 [Actinomycetota bacterium]|nr:hypothetical protein [Actinomycetota bacterium]
MPIRRARASGAEIAVLALLTGWAMFPLVLLLLRAAQLHAIFTGADGLIGADGVLGADQLQYLAWARDAGSHVLASDLFTFAPSGHVYLEPLFLVSGLLGRLGLSLSLAYLLWKPVAILALLIAAAGWSRRFFAAGVGARAAAVTLALFLCTPLASLYSWTQVGGGPFRFSLYLLGDELLAAGKLWGYLPSALGLALVPTALLAVERAIEPRGFGPATQRARSIGDAPGAWLTAVLASLGAAWLHPWQGIMLIVVYVGLAVWRRLGGALMLGLAAVGAALPLGYYYVLSHGDPAWQLAAHYEVIPRLPALVLLAGLGPPLLLAALGLRRPGREVAEQVLVLWPIAVIITYFANDAFAAHALQGLSFPLAILIVRGGLRLRLPVLVGALAVAVLTLPGLAFNARKMVRTATGSHVQYALPRSDARALAWINARRPPGGVLAPTPFASVVPYRTGKAVWVGHGYWSRDYPARARRVDRLFDGHMAPASARAFVRATGAGTVISDCAHPASLGRTLGPLLAASFRFGCARVYVLAAPGRSARR